jgi:hypothetical protein
LKQCRAISTGELKEDLPERSCSRANGGEGVLSTARTPTWVILLEAVSS